MADSAVAKFGRIRFADNDRIRRSETFDYDIILIGHKIVIQTRTKRRAQTSGANQVLYSDGNTCQRPYGQSSSKAAIDVLSLSYCRFIQSAEGM